MGILGRPQMEKVRAGNCGGNVFDSQKGGEWYAQVNFQPEDIREVPKS